LTLGSFDGLHLGHQSLIASLVRQARRDDLPSVVVTFFPHPSVVLRGRRPAYYITLPEEKAALLTAAGVDHVVTQRFDEALSRVSAGGFLDALERRIHFRQLWIGEDFALGHEREGNRLFLRREAEQRGFELHVAETLKVGGEVVSSTRVREALRAGDVARVATYLGRPFVLRGQVVQGVGRGKALGIPTANLALREEQAYPGNGVYACWAEVGRSRHPAVTNVGLRPTFDDALPAPVVETHLLDWDAELYGAEVALTFVARLREERRFAGRDELVRQIRRDIEQARELLGVGMEDADPRPDPLRDAPSGVPDGMRSAMRSATKRDPLRDAKRDDR
jgi:riboflavin kinase/FMN adenylyltransferase